jgi:hypothetical protein
LARFQTINAHTSLRTAHPRSSTMKMIRLQHLRTIARPFERRTLCDGRLWDSDISKGLAYSTDSTKSHNAVQTPVQSQKTDEITHAPLTPENESTRIQTPIQSQQTGHIASQTANSTRAPPDNRSVFRTMILCLIIAPVFTYNYYWYRKDHMEKKWERMLQEAREKQAR